MRRRQTGLGVIAAIMILVILGGLSAAIVSLSTGQQISSAQDVLSSQAWQVASAGTEGGLFRALQNNACDIQSWQSAAYPAFSVTVNCSFRDFNDGETAAGAARVLRVFRVVATACNGFVGACPDNAASAGLGYVERERIAVAACQWGGAACVGPP
jgi:MSHA biogenesis protein MshP